MISMTWPEYQRGECRVDGRPVRLTRLMADALSIMLVRHPLRTPRPLLIEALWGHDPNGGPLYIESTLFHLIRKLRERIGRDRISSKHTWGYCVNQGLAA
jgi:DNA-binding response OmpR family regulator